MNMINKIEERIAGLMSLKNGLEKKINEAVRKQAEFCARFSLEKRAT